MLQINNHIEQYVHSDETVEDLQLNSLMLIQKKDGFRFGTDAVLLSDFAKDIRSSRTLDMCTGTGAVAFLLAGKTKTPIIEAIEIQHEIADMAKRSAMLNSLSERVHITEGDLREFEKYYKKRSFDVITCNPPYAPAGTALLNSADSHTISRHEIMCTLTDVMRVSGKLLKHGGHLVMVHRPSRLADIMTAMREYEIEPKRIRMVYPNSKKPPNLILIDGTYKGGRELKFLPPLFIFDDEGKYTAEIDNIYGRN